MATRVFKITTKNDKVAFVRAQNYQQVWNFTAANNARLLTVSVAKSSEYKASEVVKVEDFRQSPCKCKKLYEDSTRGSEALYVCRCGQSKHVVRLTTAQQKTRLKSIFSSSKNNGVHHLYRKMMKQTDGLYSYDLMKQMEKFAVKNKEVISCSVDDNVYASSDLYLIPHEDKKEFLGVSALYVPQCTGEKPIRFFLYPGHLRGLLDALNKMAARCRSHGNKRLDNNWTNPKAKTLCEEMGLAESIVKPAVLKPEYTPSKQLMKQKKIHSK